jgi:hypothetical protein
VKGKFILNIITVFPMLRPFRRTHLHRAHRLSLATVTLLLWWSAQFIDLPVPLAGTTLKVAKTLAELVKS